MLMCPVLFGLVSYMYAGIHQFKIHHILKLINVLIVTMPLTFPDLMLCKSSIYVRTYVCTATHLKSFNVYTYVVTLGWYGPTTSHPHKTNAMKRMTTHTANLKTLGIASRIVMNNTCVK